MFHQTKQHGGNERSNNLLSSAHRRLQQWTRIASPKYVPMT